MSDIEKRYDELEEAILTLNMQINETTDKYVKEILEDCRDRLQEEFEEITRLINQLDVSVRQLRKSGSDLAEAERKYKVCLRQEALKLRAEKNMPVTLINQIIYGVPEVANLRFDRDVKEAVYQANQESINSTKLKLRILENQYQREWGQARGTN